MPLLSCLIILATSAFAAAAGSAPGEAGSSSRGLPDWPQQAADQILDCGTLSLYTLLKMERAAVDLRALQAAMPGMAPGGYSMKELRDAAETLGVPLEGVRLKQGCGSIDRPMIVFLERPGHGHFVTVKPVGHSGNLIQVLDEIGRAHV